MALTVGVAAGVVSPWQAAAGPDSRPGPASANATGVSSSGLAFAGTFTLAKVVAEPTGRAVAGGTLSGVLSAPGTLRSAVETQTAMPVDWDQTKANCNVMDLALGPVEVSPAVHLDQTFLAITLDDGPGSRLRVPLCALTGLLRPPRGRDAEAVAVINQILDLVHGADQ